MRYIACQTFRIIDTKQWAFTVSKISSTFVVKFDLLLDKQ